MDRRADFSRFSRTDTVRADLRRKSIRGAVFAASGGAADAVMRIVSIAILARLLLPSDFGVIAMVAAITGVVDSFRDLGLSAATVQKPDITHEQVTNLFWVNVLLGGVFASAFSLLSPFIAHFYSDDRLIGITIGLSFVFLWGGLTVQHEALMNRQLRQGELALIRFLASVLSVVIAIVLAQAGWGYWALVWREVSRSALVAVGVWLRCRWLPGMPKRGVGARSLIRFGSELSFTNVFTGIIANLDKLLIGRMFGAIPVGLYRQAQQLLLAPIEQLNGPIISVAQPALSALQEDPGRYRRYYEKIVFLVTLATLPVGLFVAVYSEEVTVLILGADWREAAVFVLFFGIAAMVRPAIGTSAVVLITCGLSTRFLALAVIHNIVLVVFLFVGVNWGPVGVVVAHIGVTLFLMIPKLYYSFKGTPVTLLGFLAATRTSVIAGAVMALGLVGVKRFLPHVAGPTLLAAGALAGGAIYLAVLWGQQSSRTQLKSLIADVKGAMPGKLGHAADRA